MNKTLVIKSSLVGSALLSALLWSGNAAAEAGTQSVIINVAIQLKDMPAAINGVGASCYIGASNGHLDQSNAVAWGYKNTSVPGPTGAVSVAVEVKVPLDKLSQAKRWACLAHVYQGASQYLVGTPQFNNLFKDDSVTSLTANF